MPTAYFHLLGIFVSGSTGTTFQIYISVLFNFSCFVKRLCIFQFFNLIPELTAYENICLPSYLDSKEPDRVYIKEVINKLGLANKIEKYPAELSGGEQQRVAVARALSCKPDIILADEPTGNLDKRTGDELMQILLLSQRYFNQTILLVTHDLELAHTAERIITLEDGRISSDLNGGQR